MMASVFADLAASCWMRLTMSGVPARQTKRNWPQEPGLGRRLPRPLASDS
jgi:hypothetical protein